MQYILPNSFSSLFNWSHDRKLKIIGNVCRSLKNKIWMRQRWRLRERRREISYISENVHSSCTSWYPLTTCVWLWLWLWMWPLFFRVKRTKERDEENKRETKEVENELLSHEYYEQFYGAILCQYRRKMGTTRTYLHTFSSVLHSM